MSLFIDIRKNVKSLTLNVSLRSEGGTLGLLGASGCGKTLVLHCIAGLARPDSGKIVLNDTILFDSEKNINLPPQKRQIGYLFENYALFPNMTVSQNILCGFHYEKNKARRQRGLDSILDQFQLKSLEKHLPAQLSARQRQQTALARVMASSPQLLILDKPFSPLDSHLRGQNQIDLHKLLSDFGKDAILATDNRNEVYHLCPQIALMDSGQLLAHKSSKALFINPESRAAALLTGCKNVAAAEKSGEYEVFVPDWGVHLATGQPVQDGLKAIAIRAHYFSPKAPQNRFPVSFIGQMEGPFEYILQFRYQGQSSSSPALWWRIPKEKHSSSNRYELGVSPVNILLLYE